MSRIAKNPDSGCWLWTGAVNSDGYGQVKRRNRTIQAHRLLYEMLREPIPSDKVIDHLCRVRRCVNPDHLEPVTFTENLRRGANTKVTPQIASEIRSRRSAGETVASIARSFGLSVALVSPISRGLKWAP